MVEVYVHYFLRIGVCGSGQIFLRQIWIIVDASTRQPLCYNHERLFDCFILCCVYCWSLKEEKSTATSICLLIIHFSQKKEEREREKIRRNRCKISSIDIIKSSRYFFSVCNLTSTLFLLLDHNLTRKKKCFILLR